MRVACFLLVSGLANLALAQSGANVTLQLPNFSSFGVQTTVLVPDSGPSPLARQRQAYYSRFTPGGLNASRAVGIERRDAMAGVTATVHDFQAADAELLRQAKARRANLSRSSLAEGLARRAADDAPPRSLEQIAGERAEQSTRAERDARHLLAQARRAQAAGRSGAAGVYYQMAARQATGALKEQIERERAQPPAQAKR